MKKILYLLLSCLLLCLFACSSNEIASRQSIETTTDDSIEKAEAMFEEAKKESEANNYMEAINKAKAALGYKHSSEYEYFIQDMKILLLNEAKKTLYVDNDEMDETTFVFARKDHHLKSGDFTCFAYVNDRSKTPVFRLYVSFTNSSWIFAKSYKMKNGDNTLTVASLKWTTEVLSGGTIFEKLDINLSKEQIEDLRNIVNGKGTTDIRFYGSEYHIDFTLSTAQKKDILTMLDYYDLKMINH